jgi:hypothetical protein
MCVCVCVCVCVCIIHFCPLGLPKKLILSDVNCLQLNVSNEWTYTSTATIRLLGFDRDTNDTEVMNIQILQNSSLTHI